MRTMERSDEVDARRAIWTFDGGNHHSEGGAGAEESAQAVSSTELAVMRTAASDFADSHGLPTDDETLRCLTTH